jgi:hypothetical protein
MKMDEPTYADRAQRPQNRAEQTRKSGAERDPISPPSDAVLQICSSFAVSIESRRSTSDPQLDRAKIARADIAAGQA